MSIIRLLKNTIEYRSPLSPIYNRMPLATKSNKIISRIASPLKSKNAKIGVEFIRAFRLLKAY